MSKIGKKPIEIPAGITVAIEKNVIVISNGKQTLSVNIPNGVDLKIEGNIATFSIVKNSKQERSNWGTVRALMQNAIDGLAKGYEKTLILEGVGYKMAKDGNDLNLNLGFSHPVKYKTPEHIVFEVEKNTTLKIKGFDKALVGQVAAEIRAMKKPEPYKGKGFHYFGEVVKRKAGKKAASGK
ncbi:MAG: 50S ribosomal protein L6 [Candidatus Paceibacterota bacterium]|jgi:large subunit ribosomal protein L6